MSTKQTLKKPKTKTKTKTRQRDQSTRSAPLSARSGYRYLFVSNADNLGATLDRAILRHFAASGAAFLMEVRAQGWG